MVAREALSSLDQSQMDTALVGHGIPPGLLILKSIAGSSKLTDLHNIRLNLDTAALYLLRLLSLTPDAGHLADVTKGKMTENAFKYR